MTNKVETKLLRENSFKVVGKLIQADVRTGKNKSGDFISINAVVESYIKGVKNEYPVSFYANKLTKDGKESKLYETYAAMPEQLNRKVQITGDLRENRYWSTGANQLMQIQVLNGRFFQGVVETSEDCGEFILGGAIVKTPVEKKNKKEDVYRYDFAILQTSYYGDSCQIFNLHINPEDREVINGVQSYEVGSTIRFTGDLDFSVREEIVEDDDVAFGAPVVKKFINKFHNFYVKGGSNPYLGDEAYPRDVLEDLIAKHNAQGVDIANAAKDNAPAASAPVAPSTKPSASQISLI